VFIVFVSEPTLSVHSVEKPKETKTESRPLSANEIHKLNKNIEWIQKNSSEIDRRIFDLGSKQFEVSWTIWYSWYLLVTFLTLFLLGLGAAIYGILYRILKNRVEKAAEEIMEQEGLYLKSVIYRSGAYLALMHAEEHSGPARKHYLELGTEFAEDSYKRSLELIELARKRNVLRDSPQFKTYENALTYAQNNLAWAISHKENPDDSDKREARRLAMSIYEMAKKDDDYLGLDTCAWVFILCGASDDEKKNGREILRGLIAREDLPPDWRHTKAEKFRELFNEDP